MKKLVGLLKSHPFTGNGIVAVNNLSGLIDPYLLSGSKDPSLLSLGHQESILAQSNSSFFGLPQNPETKNSSGFGISGVYPENRLVESIDLKENKLQEFRKYGFTSAHLAPSKGIFRGTGPCIMLSDDEVMDQILKMRWHKS